MTAVEINFQVTQTMRNIALILTCSLTLPAMAMDYPETRRVDTSNTYHEVTVADPYRWFEDWSSTEVKTWSAEKTSWRVKFSTPCPTVMLSPNVSRL